MSDRYCGTECGFEGAALNIAVRDLRYQIADRLSCGKAVPDEMLSTLLDLREHQEYVKHGRKLPETDAA